MCDVESLHLPAAAGGDRLHADREVRQRVGDLRLLPAPRAALRPLRPRALPDRGRVARRGTTTPAAGTSSTTRGDRIRTRFFVSAGGLMHKAKLPGHRRHRAVSPARRSTRPAGTTTTPAAARPSRWTSSPTRSSASSAPAPPRCRSCRSWPGRPRRSTSSSARPSAVGVRGQRPTDAGVVPPRSRRAGRPSASATSPRWSPAASPTATSSPTAGARSCARTPSAEPVDEAHAAELEAVDFEVMEGLPPARSTRSIEDPATAEQLKPWYGKHCKRICFHDEYLRGVQPAERPPRRHRRPRRARDVARRAGRRRHRVPARPARVRVRASRSPPGWSTASGSTRSAAAGCA